MSAGITFQQEELDFKFDEELVGMGKFKDYKEWYVFNMSATFARLLFVHIDYQLLFTQALYNLSQALPCLNFVWNT